ncbi:copper transporter [Lentinula raphanica]|nr:copper transporter [Lentinula raphanica]
MQARDSNGMIMSMDGSMDLASGNMLTYLHFTIGGDILWFQGWVPQGPGAMFGACVGLFILALVDRWIAACRAMMEVHWAKRLNANTNSDKAKIVPPSTLGNVLLMRRAPPFIPAHDIVRGIMHAGQAALSFAFMLAVMTFQLGFIISLVVGLGVGETLFGRYAHAGTTLH